MWRRTTATRIDCVGPNAPLCSGNVAERRQRSLTACNGGRGHISGRKDDTLRFPRRMEQTELPLGLIDCGTSGIAHSHDCFRTPLICGGPFVVAQVLTAGGRPPRFPPLAALRWRGPDVRRPDRRIELSAIGRKAARFGTYRSAL